MRMKKKVVVGKTRLYKGKLLQKHKCVNCGADYSYYIEENLLEYEILHSGLVATEADVQSAMKKKYGDCVRFIPCPECGILQPEMVYKYRKRRAEEIFLLPLVIAGLLLMPFGVFWSMKGTYNFRAALLIFLLLLFSAGRALYEVFQNPNSGYDKPVPGGWKPVNWYRIIMVLLLVGGIIAFWKGSIILSFVLLIIEMLLFDSACKCPGFASSLRK